MGFDEDHRKSAFVKSVLIIFLVSVLVFSGYFIFRDSSELQKDAIQNLEDGQESEVVIQETSELSELFEDEFKKEAKSDEDNGVEVQEGVCFLDGQKVPEGTVVSGSTCTLPSEE